MYEFFRYRPFREFNSRAVNQAHAEMVLRTSERLLVVSAALFFTPLITEGRAVTGLFLFFGFLSYLGFYVCRNIGNVLLAELEAGEAASPNNAIIRGPSTNEPAEGIVDS